MSEKDGADATRKLAEFVSAVRYDDLPASVVAKVKECILDQLGVQLLASALQWSRITYQTLKVLGGPPESTVVNYGDKTSVANAAFANASFGHGCELDDLGPRNGHGHPGCVVIPSALAMGEKHRVSGKDVVTAIVAGYEIQGRISLAASRSISLRGFHNSWFVFGAVASAGRILALTSEQMLNAIGICGSFASGLSQFSLSGGETKRLHPGHAAHSGVLSVLLAQNGFAAPPDILEGRSGYIRASSDTYSMEPLTRNLGDEWLTLETGFKRYPCSGVMHAAIETLDDMATAQRFTARDVESIVVKCSSQAAHKVGVIYEPDDAGGAQFSMPYTLAITLTRGATGVDLEAYTNEKLWRDSEILNLARRVKLEVDPECDQPYTEHRTDISHRFNQTLIATLKDGRVLREKTRPAKGSPSGEPLSWQDLVGKFEHNAGTVLPAAKLRRIVDQVAAFETMSDVSALMPHLVV
jgi:2-methylcitrate dehydratase PrpD